MTDAESSQRTYRSNTLVRNSSEIPMSDGVIPWWSNENAPPDTILDRYWRCPRCHEPMPSLYELWRMVQNRDRLARLRDEHEYGSGEWNAYNEGMHYFRGRISALTSGLDPSTRSWAMEVVRDEF